MDGRRLAKYSDRVTGRWAISWQVIVFANLLTYPQMVLTGGTLGSRQVPPEDLPTSAAIMGVTVLLNVAYATLAMFTVFRHRSTRPVPLWLYVGFYLSAGVIPVVGMEYLDAVLGEQTALPVVLRLFFACTTTLWLGLVFSLLLEGRDRFRTERVELIDEAVEIRATAIRESEAAAEIRSAMDRLVEENLARARARIDRVLEASPHTTDLEQWQDVVDEFERTARSSVRPLSHELWRRASRQFPRPSVSGVFGQLWREPRFVPWSTVLITAIGLPGASVRGFGLLAPVALAVLLAIQFVLLRWFNVAIDKVPSTAAKRVIYVSGVIVVIGLLVAYSLIPGEVVTPIQDAGSIVIAYAVGVVLVSFVGALNDSRKHVIASLRDEVTQEQIENDAQRAEIESAMRELGKVLHGPVQARLLTCAAAIEQACMNGDSDALVEALQEGSAALDYSTQHPEQRQEPLAASIDAVVSSWQAVCDIDVDIAHTLSGRVDLAMVANVVEEAIVNAYRHGLASHIDVRVEPDEESIVITVTDNGRGPTGNPAGLGMRIFDESTSGSFSLHRDADRTALRARIAPSAVRTQAHEA